MSLHFDDEGVWDAPTTTLPVCMFDPSKTVVTSGIAAVLEEERSYPCCWQLTRCLDINCCGHGAEGTYVEHPRCFEPPMVEHHNSLEMGDHDRHRWINALRENCFCSSCCDTCPAPWPAWWRDQQNRAWYGVEMCGDARGLCCVQDTIGWCCQCPCEYLECYQLSGGKFVRTVEVQSPCAICCCCCPAPPSSEVQIERVVKYPDGTESRVVTHAGGRASERIYRRVSPIFIGFLDIRGLCPLWVLLVSTVLCFTEADSQYHWRDNTF